MYIYISPLDYYELMELSPCVLINNNDVTSPVITVIFDVVLQVYIYICRSVLLIFVLFCDSLFPIIKPGILQLCPEQKLRAQTFPRFNESDTTD